MFHLVFEIAIRDIIQNARFALEKSPIQNESRGWQHDSEDLRPPYPGPTISVSQILGLSAEEERWQNADRLTGDMIHSLYHRLVKTPQNYLRNIEGRHEVLGMEEFLASRRAALINEILSKNTDVARALEAGVVNQGWVTAQKKSLTKIWDYESRLLAALVANYWTAHPHHSIEALTGRCIPFESEIECDGSLLLLSENLRIDARTTHGAPMIVDVKTGNKSQKNRIAVTGYALAWESQESAPVDYGCVYYLQVPRRRPAPLFEIDVFPITTTLRQTFIERRNDLLVMENESETN